MSCLPSTRASHLQLDLASDGRLLRLVSGRVRDLVRGSSEGLGLVIEGKSSLPSLVFLARGLLCSLYNE